MAIADSPTRGQESIVDLVRDRGMEIVGVARDFRDLLDLLGRTGPDVTIVDPRIATSGMDGTVSPIRLVRRRWPAMAMLVLAQKICPSLLEDIRSAAGGPIGYLSRDRLSNGDKLVEVVDLLLAGVAVVEHEVLTHRPARDHLAGLTDRQRDILGLMAEGATNQSIAERLCISVNTVEKHCNAIFAKLRLGATPGHRRVLAVLAYRRGVADDIHDGYYPNRT